MTTSFILTRQEWDYVTSGEGGAETLCGKGMAKRTEDGGIELARELQVIAEEFSGAEHEELSPGVTAVRGRRFAMLIEPYRHLHNALKISLYENGAELDKELEERELYTDDETAH